MAAAQQPQRGAGTDVEEVRHGVSSVVMTGEAFRTRVHGPSGGIDQAAFNELWPQLSVLARCSPKDKYTIIQGCQAYRLPGNRRDIVAMTGARPLRYLHNACQYVCWQSLLRRCPRRSSA
jgi:hypothetical protein